MHWTFHSFLHFFIFILLSSISLSAQEKQVNKHQVFWHKTDLNQIFVNQERPNSGWGVGMDFVFRTKSTYESPSMFTELNRLSIRPWVHYQFSPNARLSLSPIGLMYTDDYKARASDYNRAPYDERRITLQFFHHTKEKNPKFMHTWRYRYEIRWQETADGSYRYFNRFRLRYRLRYVITGKNFYNNNTLYVAVNNEIGINIGKNVPYMFNQNRFYLAGGYRFLKAMRVELRYVDRYRARGSVGNEYDNARGLMLTFYVDQFSLLGSKSVQDVRFYD